MPRSDDSGSLAAIDLRNTEEHDGFEELRAIPVTGSLLEERVKQFLVRVGDGDARFSCGTVLREVLHGGRVRDGELIPSLLYGDTAGLREAVLLRGASQPRR